MLSLRTSAHMTQGHLIPHKLVLKPWRQGIWFEESQNGSNTDRFCRYSNLGNSVVLICLDNFRCWSSQNCSCRLLKTILQHANLRISASTSAFCSRLQLGKGHARMPSAWKGGGIQHHHHQALVMLFRRTPSLRSGQGQHDLNHLTLRLQFGPVAG